MKPHPLHPISVHAPIACIAFAPLCDLAAWATGEGYFWTVSALMTAGAVLFGFVAASFGATDFERAFARAPKTVTWHASLMSIAVTLDGASALGRFAPDFTPLAMPAPWAIGASAAALLVAGVGGFLGGDLVYRHGVNVADR